MNTAPSTPRVAFIFGAEASRDFGAPLMREFMGCARELARTHEDMREALAEVEAWRLAAIARGALKEYASAADDGLAPDADNLEDMMCLLDIESEFIEAGRARVATALKYLVARCFWRATQEKLDRVLDAALQRKTPCCGYDTLVRRLRSIEDGLLWNDRCSFLTFNYDVTLDTLVAFTPAYSFSAVFGQAGFHESDPKRIALAQAAVWPLYWLGPANDLQLGYYVPRLLKLHGSLNWGVCADPECDAPVQQFPMLCHHPTIGIRPTDPVSKMAADPCQYHLARQGAQNGHKPYILSPSWKRGSLRYALRRVWTRACQDIREATRVVVVGHSLPPTDAYFRYVLASALTTGAKKRVLVVSPELERYRAFLSTLLPEGCYELHQHCFAQSVDHIVAFASQVLRREES